MAPTSSSTLSPYELVTEPKTNNVSISNSAQTLKSAHSNPRVHRQQHSQLQMLYAAAEEEGRMLLSSLRGRNQRKKALKQQQSVVQKPTGPYCDMYEEKLIRCKTKISASSSSSLSPNNKFFLSSFNNDLAFSSFFGSGSCSVADPLAALGRPSQTEVVTSATSIENTGHRSRTRHKEFEGLAALFKKQESLQNFTSRPLDYLSSPTKKSRNQQFNDAFSSTESFSTKGPIKGHHHPYVPETDPG